MLFQRATGEQDAGPGGGGRDLQLCQEQPRHHQHFHQGNRDAI